MSSVKRQSDDQSSAVDAQWTPPAVNGGDAAVECAACGHVGKPVGRGQCGKCRAFVKRNVAGMIHGGRRERPLANPEDSELYQDWAADLGGDLTAGQRAVLRRAAEADAVCQSALDYVLRTRESLVAVRVLKALSVLATHSTNVFRAAGVLGINRVEKHVNPLERVRQAVREANRDTA